MFGADGISAAYDPNIACQKLKAGTPYPCAVSVPHLRLSNPVQPEQSRWMRGAGCGMRGGGFAGMRDV